MALIFGLWLGILPRFSLSQPNSIQLCGAALPHAFGKYKDAVERKYGEIQCASGNVYQSKVEEGHPATLVLGPGNPDKSGVAHELMHMWLGTQGWNTDPKLLKGKFQAPQGVSQQSVDSTYVYFANWLQHRMFQSILDSNGLSYHEAAIAQVKKWLPTYDIQPQRAADLAVTYLSMEMQDREAAKMLENYIKRRGWQDVFEIADYYRKTVDQDDPRNQEQADETIKKCLAYAYDPGSKFAQPLPLAAPVSAPNPAR